jgi:Ca2+-binding RTX toxin-like protein
MTLIPGFQYRLHNPLGSVGYPPTSLDATDFIFSNPNGTTTKIVVGDPVIITLTWGVGTLSLDIDGQSETNQVETVTSITAANGHVALIGTSGNDIIDGEGSDTLIAGGPGNDTIIGYGGSDWMDGGGGNDTVTYAAIADSLAVTLATVNGTTETGDPIIKVSGITTGGSDTIVSVETIRLGSGQDRITVASADDLNTKLTVDMADSDRQVSPFNLDVYDLSNLSEGVTYRSGKVALGWSGPLSSFAGFAENLVVKNADKIVLTPFDDTVISANYGNVIHTGAGADKIWIGSDGVAIDDLSEFGERGRLCGQGPDRTAVPTDVYFWPEADLPRAGPRCSVRHRRQTSSRRH